MTNMVKFASSVLFVIEAAFCPSLQTRVVPSCYKCCFLVDKMFRLSVYLYEFQAVECCGKINFLSYLRTGWMN